MNRPSLIVSIGALSLGIAACGGYDEKGAAYNEQNAAYDENTAYDAGNESYNESEDNAVYAPPAESNESYNELVEPPTNVTTNNY